jgi:hypothetical protein
VSKLNLAGLEVEFGGVVPVKTQAGIASLLERFEQGEAELNYVLGVLARESAENPNWWISIG